MVTRENIYELYDDGKLIFKGNRESCAKQIGCQPQSLIHKYTHKGEKMLGRFTLKLVGQEKKVYELKRKNKVESVITKRQTTLEYLIKHLSKYGNTILNTNPEKYLKQLKKEGYDCLVRKVKEDGHNRYFYVLEVK